MRVDVRQYSRSGQAQFLDAAEVEPVIIVRNDHRKDAPAMVYEMKMCQQDSHASLVIPSTKFKAGVCAYLAALTEVGENLVVARRKAGGYTYYRVELVSKEG